MRCQVVFSLQAQGDSQKYSGIAGPKPASNTPKKTLAARMLWKLKVVDFEACCSVIRMSRHRWSTLTIKVETVPQPTAAPAIQTRGGTNLETIVAGI